jgi:hypothetical protein
MILKSERPTAMKTRTAKMSDYDWIKAMSQRHKAELGFVAYGAIKDSIKNREMLVAEPMSGFCRWHKRRDGWHVVYDLVSEKKGAGGALLLAVPLPRRLKAPLDIEANGFYKYMGGQIVYCELGKKRHLNVWVWPAVNVS